MDIELQTLTPIWTGGVQSKETRTHATGIIGSLRWWYEAILRGLGNKVCDPTKHVCPDKHGNHCPACDIYGTTGWSRRFRISVTHGNTMDYTRRNLNILPQGRTNGWFLPAGMVGPINLKMQHLHEHELCQIAYLLPLRLMENRGTIGAKTEHGYGAFKITQPVNLNQTLTEAKIEKLLGNTDQQRKLPDLRDFFFIKIHFDTQGNWWDKVKDFAPPPKQNATTWLSKFNEWVTHDCLPVSPVVRNAVRNHPTFNGLPWNVQNFFFGTKNSVCIYCFKQVKDYCKACNKSLKKSEKLDGVASKLRISSAFPTNKAGDKWEFRIWGWIPQTLPEKMGSLGGKNSADFVTSLKKTVENFEWSDLLGDNTDNFDIKAKNYNSWLLENENKGIQEYLFELLKSEVTDGQ